MNDERLPYGGESEAGFAVEDLDAWLLPDIPYCDRKQFVDLVFELGGETRRRTLPAARSAPRRASARDHRRGPVEPKVELVLYTSNQSEKSQRAVKAIQDVLSQYDSSQVQLKTCDLAACPEDGEVDSVVFTPMLVKHGPGPRTAIIGNLEDREILRELLDASGIERRRWDD